LYTKKLLSNCKINMSKTTSEKNISTTQQTKKRTKVSQSDIPSYSLTQALRVASAIHEGFGKEPAKPLWVAQAMNVSPNSSVFKMITGASIAYGLTDGGYNAASISLTPLGRKILAPKAEGEDLMAKREAMLKPRIISTFLRQYDDSLLPIESIAINILEDMGVPRDRAKNVYDLICESAESVGFFKTIKDKRYVDLHSAVPAVSHSSDNEDKESDEDIIDGEKEDGIDIDVMSTSKVGVNAQRVFITHGKNQTFIEPIKKLLKFGGFEAVVAAEKQTVSQPVPEKVMETMRSCGAAIIHIDAELKLMDAEANELTVLNPNVLIEIGAAMALYGKRFVLLVKDGVQMPSNLQGLYEVRYAGEMLDSDVTIRLLEAINDIKSHSLPNN
jgi:predicted nucleotide-binding protein